jgi:hypothetical protein
VIALLYIAIGALAYHLVTRKPKEDPTMGGRIVPNGNPEAHAAAIAWHKQQHDTFSERHTVDWDTILRDIAHVETPEEVRARVDGYAERHRKHLIFG